MVLIINDAVVLSEDEIECTAICSQGSGGQNVNKVSSAIHLRFDILSSTLPDFYKQRLLELQDKRLTKDGIIIIKAQRFRTQEKNREDALLRLVELIRSATLIQKSRRPTRPSKAAKARRTDSKILRGKVKSLRGKVDV
ncbi:MAG: aminoacyl-tRNA hydrolase [Cellvibrio sp.]|nr:aminoacyl-tRNA hydrolase [Cellvibrio sp.]